MSRSHLSLCMALLAASCVAPNLDSPWDFSRTQRVMPLERGESQVRGQYLNGDDSSTGVGADLQYGVLGGLTLGLGVGEDLRSASLGSVGFGDRIASAKATAGILGDHDEFGVAGQFEVILRDDDGIAGSRTPGDVEFRPTVAAALNSDEIGVTGRTGLGLVDGIDPAFLIEGAVWARVGDANLTAELDGTFGDGFDEVFFTPGVVTQLREIAQLQFAVPIGMTSDSEDWQLLAGMIFRF